MAIRPNGVTKTRKPGQQPPPARPAPPTAPAADRGRDVVEQRQPHHPLHAGQRGQRHATPRPAPARSRRETGVTDAGFDRRRRVELVEVAGQRAESGMVVEVGDRHLRVARAQRGHQLRRRQRAAAEGEEVGLRPVDGRGEHVAPQPGQPARGAAEVGVVGVVGVAVERPRQRVAVDLARRPGRQFVDAGRVGAPAPRAATRPARRGPPPGRSRGRRSRRSRPAAGCRSRSGAPRPRRR